MSDSVQRVLTRYRQQKAAAGPGDLEAVLQQMLTIHGRIKTWLRMFPSALREAQREAPSGKVWQDPFVGFFESYDMYQRQLFDLGRKLDSMSQDPRAKKAKFAVEPMKGSRVNDAIKDLDFADHPDGGSAIVYPVRNLQGWYKNFSEWTFRSSELIKSIL